MRRRGLWVALVMAAVLAIPAAAGAAALTITPAEGAPGQSVAVSGTVPVEATTTSSQGPQCTLEVENLLAGSCSIDANGQLTGSFGVPTTASVGSLLHVIACTPGCDSKTTLFSSLPVVAATASGLTAQPASLTPGQRTPVALSASVQPAAASPCGVTLNGAPEGNATCSVDASGALSGTVDVAATAGSTSVQLGICVPDCATKPVIATTAVGVTVATTAAPTTTTTTTTTSSGISPTTVAVIGIIAVVVLAGAIVAARATRRRPPHVPPRVSAQGRTGAPVEVSVQRTGSEPTHVLRVEAHAAAVTSSERVQQ